MKQVYVIATRYSMSYEVFNKWFNHEKTILTVDDAYAIFHAKPFYTETVEEALERYKEKGWHNCSWGLKNIIDSSENFDWDVCLHHKSYEKWSKSIIPQECRIKNFVDSYHAVLIKNLNPSFTFIKENMQAEDFREWLWDGQKNNNHTPAGVQDVRVINTNEFVTQNGLSYDSLDLAF